MKILYFSPHPHINMGAPSGPGTHIREVIAGFESQGHQVVRFIAGGESINQSNRAIVFKKNRWKQFIPSIIWETLRDIQMIRNDRKLEKQLLRLIDENNPELIYERSCYGMGAGRRAAKTRGVRYIVEMNAPYPEEKAAMQGRSLLNFVGWLHERKQVGEAYRTIVVSSAMKNYLVQKLSVDERRIVVVANAVNLDHIRSNHELRQSIRSTYGLQSSNVVIGFVGSIFPYHGVDLMIDAFASLEKKYPHIRMLIVGDGEILPTLQKGVAQMRLENKVHFTGNVPHHQVYDYLALMDIAVMARSNWYGSPVKIFEYGAMGKSIIAPRVVPVEDVMIHEEHGLLIHDTSEDLKAALSFLLDHPEKSKQMARAFQQEVLSKHTWQNVALKIVEACK